MKLLYGLLFLYEFLNLSFCSVINENKLNTTGFRILEDEKTVELTNPHQTNGKLKFTFEGGNISKVEHTPLLWSFLMSGDTKNRVDIHKIGPINSNITTAYEVRWIHIHENISDPQICFEMGSNNASWSSTYLEVDQPWPYNTGKPMAKRVSFNTGSYSSDQLGPVVNNLFFTSDGFAIFFDPGFSPKFIQRLPNERLCFTEKSTHGRAQYTDITVSLYTGVNIQAIRQLMAKQYFKLRSPSNHQIPDERMFKDASMTLDTRGRNQSQIIEQAKELAGHGLKNLQLVLLSWEAHYGDLTFDQIRFPNPKDFISELHKLGFLVKLTVNSFVSEQSINFKLKETLLLKKDHHTYTFNWTNHGNGTLWDVLNNIKTSPWISNTLAQLQKVLGVDSYRFVGCELGTFGLQEMVTDGFPSTHQSNTFSSAYGQLAQRLGNLVEVDAAYVEQNWHSTIRLRDIEPIWVSLKYMVRNALTMGLANYNFLMAPNFKTPASEELYIRWLQAITFFPSIQLPNAPWKISDKAANLTSTFLTLRADHVATIIAEAKHSASDGSPLLRSLWYLAPEDSRTYAIDDQFALGNDLIVAPVLTQGQVKRQVYLPAGKWIDAHGKSYTGPGSITVHAPLEELPYFKRQHL